MKESMTQICQTLIQNVLSPLGLDLVSADFLTGREKKLRVNIERQDRTPVGMEDCVLATKALDEPLDASVEIQTLFPASYELEVSSPGAERPLTKLSDYERFKGQRVRIHTYRPLTGAELSNEAFAAKNPKQKNFVGTLGDASVDAVSLQLEDDVLLSIPTRWIAKANLEPDFEALGQK